MQNHESHHHFWKTKGSYLLLGLCAAAVAVSGYVFLRDAAGEEAALSVPLTAEAPIQEELPAALQEDPVQEPAAPVQSILEQSVMPVSGTVIQDHAMDHLIYNPTTRDWRVHNGVDLAAPLGQEVRAARDGTVTAVYEDDCYGVTVIVEHRDGYTSHYAGLAAEPPVQAGQSVTAGQTVGVIGATALMESAQEPHLHFEVYLNAAPMDPAGFLY